MEYLNREKASQSSSNFNKTIQRHGKVLMDNRNHQNQLIQRKSSGKVIQKVLSQRQIATSIRNVQVYATDMYRTYGAATIRAVLIQNNFRVRGHASGGSGSGQNAATTQDLATLRGYLQAYTPPTSSGGGASSSSGGRRARGGASLSTAKGKGKGKGMSKEEKKAAKKAKRKAEFEKAKKDNFGKRPPKGGGGSGAGAGITV